MTNFYPFQIEFFDLDAKTGVLTTKNDFPLDYETLQDFNITITARDESNLQSVVRFIFCKVFKRWEQTSSELLLCHRSRVIWVFSLPVCEHDYSGA